LPLFRRAKPEPTATRITMSDLTISPEGLDASELLSEWLWLVDQTFSPLLLSAVGDFFLQAGDCSVHRLATGEARLEKVAENVEEFKQLLVQPEKASLWLLPEIVAHFKERGVGLRPDQCNSYKVAPFLGGKIEPDNFELADIYVHFGLLGQIACQVKDLPPGTKIGRVKFKPQ
jgi:hypothetical protein